MIRLKITHAHIDYISPKELNYFKNYTLHNIYMTDRRSRRWLFGRPPGTRRSSSGCSSWSYIATASDQSCVSRSQSHDSHIPGDDRRSWQRWWVHGSCCGACRTVCVPSHPDLRVLQKFVLLNIFSIIYSFENIFIFWSFEEALLIWWCHNIHSPAPIEQWVNLIVSAPTNLFRWLYVI